MPGMTGTFDARTIEPKQGGGAHPVGNKFAFTISDTDIHPAKDGKSRMLTIEFTSQAGSIEKHYILWHENETTKTLLTERIAGGQLSLLCHATGIFQIQFDNDCAALRGAQGMMDVGFQKGHEPTAEKPSGGYVEIKKIYDKNGNEPGKVPVNAQGNAGWGGSPQATQQQPAPQANPPNGGWNNTQPANQQAAAPQQQPANGGGGWQQGNGQQNPPWGPR